MNKRFETVLLGALGGTCAALIVSAATLHIMQQPRHVEVFPTAFLHSPGSLSARAEKRHASLTWPGLTEKQAEAITSSLRASNATGAATIFCAEDVYCGDLQEDLRSAFEKAGWTVGLERPLLDTTSGISTSSPDLASAIEFASDGSIPVKMIPRSAGYFAVVIGRHATDLVRAELPMPAPSIMAPEPVEEPTSSSVPAADQVKAVAAPAPGKSVLSHRGHHKLAHACRTMHIPNLLDAFGIRWMPC